jgi:hypothetical protein
MDMKTSPLALLKDPTLLKTRWSHQRPVGVWQQPL